jgi:hypothetical protein
MVDIRKELLERMVIIQGRGGAQRNRRDLLGGRMGSDILLPIRHLRVLYALEAALYQSARTSIALEAHEFICPQSKLSQFTSPAMQTFLKRIAPHKQAFPS